MNLWIDGDIISVKHSTLRLDKDSRLAKDLIDDTVTTEDGTKMILMEYSSVMLSIINQLHLQSLMIGADELPLFRVEKL